MANEGETKATATEDEQVERIMRVLREAVYDSADAAGTSCGHALLDSLPIGSIWTTSEGSACRRRVTRVVCSPTDALVWTSLSPSYNGCPDDVSHVDWFLVNHSRDQSALVVSMDALPGVAVITTEEQIDASGISQPLADVAKAALRKHRTAGSVVIRQLWEAAPTETVAEATAKVPGLYADLTIDAGPKIPGFWRPCPTCHRYIEDDRERCGVCIGPARMLTEEEFEKSVTDIASRSDGAGPAVFCEQARESTNIFAKRYLCDWHAPKRWQDGGFPAEQMRAPTAREIETACRDYISMHLPGRGEVWLCSIRNLGLDSCRVEVTDGGGAKEVWAVELRVPRDGLAGAAS